NDGFVLPMAIDRAVWIAFRPRGDGRVALHSLDFGEDAGFEVGDDTRRGEGWVEYVRGVAWALGETGRPVCGWEGVVAGDVPLGAGLSSSAALELAVARAFAGACDLSWEPAAMARLAQRAENEWVGVNSGIMDQMISASGRAGHCLLIDCRTLETRAVPLPADAAVVILDTATRRGLVDSAYNDRRGQCEQAAAFFGVRALRDVDEATFAARAAELGPVIRRRARHVVSENARTVAAAGALAEGNVRRVGELMDASHQSLRDDFEVSRPELDAMVGLARSHDGCHGARMTGAGFGGCAVALVQRRAAEGFARDVAARYEAEVGLRPAVYVCAASQGASLEGVSPDGSRPGAG
ncbi:MAG TPA: galactokinase, partial [Gemmatimonadaceae bacterium]|nr:galactokinase [Gemmatimonadaceae bacterium]